MATYNRTYVGAGVAATALLLIVAGAYFFAPSGIWPKPELGAPTSTASAQGAPARPSSASSGGAPSLDLSDSQLASVKVEPVGEREFPIEKESVGGIDFNEDMTLPGVHALSREDHRLVRQGRRRREEGPDPVHHRQPRPA